ncbi:polyamine aminopropyltransferase [Pseudohongiella sp.]|uniref:PABS domain-containing protein n=1 Tax=marine sediment metagenome TaxID=412755 RepID=A0A0F9WJ10_9ZZZZ|nr:polyamine aminopropyltransferase [Pseudohongiella sp.]HDZ07664.1 polyamine aminopropyltransferase [Pseudohongiella sp.]HEA63244.1 polyamine aminopropyltransferase [Pseudohongiella sp.]
MSARHWTETLYSGYGQSFTVDEVLFEHKTDHQHLMIFNNRQFGRVMALDGIVQTTERDEFIYHEMLTHVPLMAHGNATRVLIIGGGDGGILREVCRHQSVAHVTQVEIDQAVIDMAREYLPAHSDGAYDDPRANIVIGDGFDFVQTTDQRFDVIISDSTDPQGPGEILFTKDFYAGCQRCLNPGGILVTQNGVVFMQTDEVTNTAGRLNRLYRDWHFYGAAVPTYVGGIMTFAWASDEPSLRRTDLATLQKRWQASAIHSRYYTPELHHAAFALPQYVLDKLAPLKHA